MVDASSFISTVPVPSVDATGLHVPAFSDILAALQNDYRSVYGADALLDPDDQDGNWIGIQAKAFSDYCDAFAAAYNAYSPATAQGVGLSSIVKTNGIARDVPSASTADLTIVGTVGTIINNGVVSDNTYRWSLPAQVVIPFAGQIVVTATCQTLGAIAAAPGTINRIQTITKGWQTASNAAAATPGSPIETDPQLRVRQSASTMLAATGVVDGILGAILALGAARARIYENDTSAPDANGIPGHTISAVVDGGDAVAIATAIARRKLSAGTYGTTSEIVTTGAAQIPRTIAFFRPTQPSISWTVTIKPLTGFTTDVQTAIQQALSSWTNALGIGAGQAGRIMLARAYTAALLTGPQANSFELVSLMAARDGATPAATDVPIAFNEAPFCTPAAVAVVPATS